MMLKLAQTSVFFPRPYEILGKKYKANLVLILTQINYIKIICVTVSLFCWILIVSLQYLVILTNQIYAVIQYFK